MTTSTPTESDLLFSALKLMKSAVWPGKGKEHAQFVRQVCDQMGWNEDTFLESFVIKDKPLWGLPERTHTTEGK